MVPYNQRTASSRLAVISSRRSRTGRPVEVSFLIPPKITVETSTKEQQHGR
jgi:hypothetical protein